MESRFEAFINPLKLEIYKGGENYMQVLTLILT